MKKPLTTFDREEGSLKSIVHQTWTKKQLVKQNDRNPLTDRLSILNNSVHTGSTAIFALATLRCLEVAG